MNTDRDQSFSRCLPDIKLLCPSKLNLCLSITDRKPNGFHLLESLFWPVDYCDEMTIKYSDESSVTIAWHQNAPVRGALPALQNNLLFHLLSKLPKNRCFQLRVLKKIPIGGGLGGGSSNAGSLLRFLRKQNVLTRHNAVAMAEALGADVPFFLNPIPSWVTGIGENIGGLDIDPTLCDSLTFLLVFPPFEIPTKKVFEMFRKDGKFSLPTRTPDIKNFANLASFLESRKNDLEPMVLNIYPEIRQVIKALCSVKPITCGLSGSGSTCFALFSNKELAQTSAQVLSSIFRKYNCKSAIVSTYREVV